MCVLCFHELLVLLRSGGALGCQVGFVPTSWWALTCHHRAVRLRVPAGRFHLDLLVQEKGREVRVVSVATPRVPEESARC